jgi:hypothetical protein
VAIAYFKVLYQNLPGESEEYNGKTSVYVAVAPAEIQTWYLLNKKQQC